jgi:hypothetical protein
MHRATIAHPNPVAKTTPMKITQTFCPGYPISNLVRQNCLQQYSTSNSTKQMTHSTPIKGLPSCRRYTRGSACSMDCHTQMPWTPAKRTARLAFQAICHMYCLHIIVTKLSQICSTYRAFNKKSVVNVSICRSPSFVMQKDTARGRRYWWRDGSVDSSRSGRRSRCSKKNGDTAIADPVEARQFEGLVGAEYWIPYKPVGGNGMTRGRASITYHSSTVSTSLVSIRTIACLQWCRRRNAVNLRLHNGHADTFSSGSQLAPAPPWLLFPSSPPDGLEPRRRGFTWEPPTVTARASPTGSGWGYEEPVLWLGRWPCVRWNECEWTADSSISEAGSSWDSLWSSCRDEAGVADIILRARFEKTSSLSLSSVASAAFSVTSDSSKSKYTNN